MTTEKNTYEKKIAIIGAGAGGISAAHFLKQKGYKNIKIFEKRDYIGGKCYTEKYNNNFYDMGALAISPSYTEILKLQKEYHVLVEKFSGTHRVLNPITMKVANIKEGMRKGGYTRIFLDLFRYIYLIYPYRYLRKQGFTDYPSELLIPFSEFLNMHQLNSLENVFTFIITHMGYGELNDITTAKVVKYIKMMDVIAFFSICALGKNYFKVREFKNGFQSLWETIAYHQKNSFEIKLNADINEIKYIATGIQIKHGDGIEVFDKLIITAPPDQLIDKIKNATFQTDLFKKVVYFPFTTTLIKIKNSDNFPTGITISMPPILDGRPMIIKKSYHGGEVYITYSMTSQQVSFTEAKYLDDNMVKETIYTFLTYLGLNQSQCEFIAIRRWLYYPHALQKDVKLGFDSQLNELQGQQNTYYSGGLFSFELTESIVCYSKYVIETFF